MAKTPITTGILGVQLHIVVVVGHYVGQNRARYCRYGHAVATSRQRHTRAI